MDILKYEFFVNTENVAACTIIISLLWFNHDDSVHQWFIMDRKKYDNDRHKLDIFYVKLISE